MNDKYVPFVINILLEKTCLSAQYRKSRAKKPSNCAKTHLDMQTKLFLL